MAITSSRAISGPAIIAGLGGGNAVGTNATATGATLTNSLSTGNATNPNLVIQVGVKTSSGAAQATATTALTIVGETLAATFAGAVAVTGSVTGVVDLTMSGNLVGGAFRTATTAQSWGANGLYITRSTGLYGWSADSTITGSSDTNLARIAAGQIGSNGSFSTLAPAGASAGAWKLGSLVTAAVVLDTTRSVFIDIGGTVYKLMVAQ